MATVIGVATVAIWVYLLFFRGGFWWLPYRPAPLAANIGGRSVVAVIPARDEAAVVGRAVASLLAQDYDGDFRIVLVDLSPPEPEIFALSRVMASDPAIAAAVRICCTESPVRGERLREFGFAGTPYADGIRTTASSTV